MGWQFSVICSGLLAPTVTGGHGLGSADNQNVFMDEMINQVRPLSTR